ncbi:hypothetical protein ACTHSZ_21600, partial [Neisseria sp. P0006.S006]
MLKEDSYKEFPKCLGKNLGFFTKVSSRLKIGIFSDDTVYIDNNFLRKYNDYILSEITDILN